MIDAAMGKRQADVGERAVLRLLVATWAEALPLLGFAPRVTGMGCRSLDIGDGEALLLAGFAGACQPWLRPGDVLLAGDAPAELRSRLGAVSGEVRTLDHIANPAEKSALGGEGVAAVDMETAWLAAASNVPFVSVRVIIDRLEDPAVSVATAWHYMAACRSLRKAVGEAYEFLSHPNGRGPTPS
ncbi:MAG TPA: hypothetical protein VMW62_07090 [Chloroflexota bacterium]|nr:hypothetical protein [Chloroflexota bacterium]